MEKKVELLETDMRSVKDDLHVMSKEVALTRQTLDSINNTLIEMRAATLKLNEVLIKQAEQGKDIKQLEHQVGILFKKSDTHESEIDTVKDTLNGVQLNDSIKSLKISGAEKVLYTIITFILAIAATYWGAR